MEKQALYIILLLSLLTSSCHQQRKQYVIGVSQCSEDIWREKQNREMRMGTYFHDDVELRFTSALDSDERQRQQIDSLVAGGIDLLIVAPNQVNTINPAIDRAYDQGIPVIVFERKTDSQKYTAYIGTDNYEMGRLMGEYIASRLNGKGRVLEIMGLKGSSPAIERHNGFADATGRHPDIQLAATLQGDWTEESAYEATRGWLSANTRIDFVFAQNDRMAMGVRRALMEAGIQPLPHFCGIDGLPGEGGGIQLVRDGILDASYLYPTHGDQLLDLAINILKGEPYEKETKLQSALVTRDNANVLFMQSEETKRQSNYIDRLSEQSNLYLSQLGTQRVITILSVGSVLLLLGVVFIIYIYTRQRTRIDKERRQMERQQLDFYTTVSHQLRTPLTLIEGPLSQLAATTEMTDASNETKHLFDIVRRNAQQLTSLVNKILKAETHETPQATDDTMADSELPTAEPTADANENAERPTILIVDDNADILTYLRKILENRYIVLEADNGEHGLQQARQEVPDIIVSDVMMPVMNGLEFCQRVKNDTVTSHIPVVLLTARALSKHQIEGYQSGADAYLTKPFSADVLLARVDNLLRNRRQLRNLFKGKQDSLEPATPSQPTPRGEETLSIHDQEFIEKFRKAIEGRLTDSEFSVEALSAEMNLSRVQLYRKIKALTGSSPVELLRKARLNRGRKLLETTGKSISEVAYEVGFTAPSYFTKCFKDEFGISPSELGAR
ncbi:MAG: substrate-binding domain-containing protein [Prevotella sp.]|nr:substrate-binding domain-containing protein [Prevotella sp.]